jgi:hypothetical protein
VYNSAAHSSGVFSIQIAIFVIKKGKAILATGLGSQ